MVEMPPSLPPMLWQKSRASSPQTASCVEVARTQGHVGTGLEGSARTCSRRHPRAVGDVPGRDPARRIRLLRNASVMMAFGQS